jgi:hypothetical protein
LLKMTVSEWRPGISGWRDGRLGPGVGAGTPKGLIPRYPARRRRRVSEGIVELARVARTEYRWGVTRTRTWLERVHQIRVNAKTIQRVFCDLGHEDGEAQGETAQAL